MEDLRVHIRWMIRRDMPEVLAIEKASFKFPWCEEEFLRVLRQRNCIGMVAEHGEEVVGLMIYTLHKGHVNLINFAVHPEFRRRSVGRQLINKLKGKLSVERRSRIRIDITEWNDHAHLYFRRWGHFSAVDILRDDDGDVYRFEYMIDHRQEAAAAAVSSLEPS